MENISERTQKYLGNRGLILFLALLSAFVPLSTDLYLPALPIMARFFHVSEFKMNLTLILFFAFYSLATLVWGPLSDKYGRKPILLIGLTGYMLASILCAVSGSVNQLILFRILQAVGGGAASAVATAVVKDVYQGKKQESILAIVQSMVVISPAVAPVIGALLLKFTSWRGIFFAQAILGLVVVIGSIAFQETIGSENSTAGLITTIGRLGVVLRNPSFTVLLIIFSAVNIASMAFISSSSYIYQDSFELSSQKYSYFFTFNAVGMLIGPLLYIRLSGWFKRFHIICACFAIIILSGILIYTLGWWKPWIFALTLLPAAITESCVRPPSTYLILKQQENDAGSASSLLSSATTVMGSVGMLIVSFNQWNPVQLIGKINIIVGFLCGGAWLIAVKELFLDKIQKE
ncbi:MAG: Bcr/CflA family efflux MFS transporter [Clostridium sp.]|jgi:DHA1 family bicyclomycin/chloramphenicol resistance-like MFS transporter|uniref:Bcr/CflA family efflux MFS transporter n=1 Tax=Clostridium sp. TaxID=1506 RepID=UPI0025BF4781|nr:Bcr/CflA family efflux MFS transporter [Clostridium sp.]MCH3963450.1 Bcr/CflA family efflux MFS transporter [Clostridium sp.]MCI1716682.1 Bcr/CflA family efflux MFS transporter [Clostridium sp.]MCI1801134.1 Bcr/CflA family efflux MFS transporter [Clostridium sp.]MCI1814868.1 Bcr/CflA family efflux MFS transporter [Clostridium sp.]MCI1871769.1 Bcr/CflA family efflux MFS transporter [Clostridium sp.]